MEKKSKMLKKKKIKLFFFRKNFYYNPYENKDFRRWVFKFYIQLPIKTVNLLKLEDKRNLQYLGLNLISAISFLPHLPPNDVSVNLIVSSKRILITLRGR